MAYPVTAVKHPQGLAVWTETGEDRKEKEVFRASLNGTIEDVQPVKKGR
jgi:hypothetical protein